MEIFPRYWPFVSGIHQSPVHSQVCSALMFSLIYAWTNSWTNSWVAGDLGHHRAHHGVTVMHSPSWNLCHSMRFKFAFKWANQQASIDSNYKSTQHGRQATCWTNDDIISNHLPLSKMTTIRQMVFSEAFSLMDGFIFWSRFSRSLLLNVPMTITKHWFI